MSIQEIFNSQKELMLNFFPINKDAELIVFNSVRNPVVTYDHRYVCINCNITDFDEIQRLCWVGLIPKHDDIKEN